MRCDFCLNEGHTYDNCPDRPKGIGKRNFSDDEKKKAEKNIEEVKESFTTKLGGWRGKAPFLKDAVAMYYCMVDPRTPFWVKASIAVALLYFISPIQAIPHSIPVVGYADDALAIYTTLKVIHNHITEDHIKKAEDWPTDGA